MLQRIRFVARKTAARGPTAPNTALVSIHDRSEPALELLPGWSDVLVQRFHDTDGSLMGLEVFSEAQALEVLAFAERHKSCAELAVQCQAGHSRSAAIALYLSEKYGVPCYQEQAPATRDSWKFYNRLVYQRMSQVDRQQQ